MCASNNGNEIENVTPMDSRILGHMQRQDEIASFEDIILMLPRTDNL
jgi:hypothetical protein